MPTSTTCVMGDLQSQFSQRGRNGQGATDVRVEFRELELEHGRELFAEGTSEKWEGGGCSASG